MHRRTLLKAFLSTGFALVATVAPAQPTVEGFVAPGCGALPRTSVTGTARWTTSIHRTGTRFLRLRFTDITLDGDAIIVVVRDLRGQSRSLTLHAIRSGQREWTRLFEGDRVDVTVNGATSGQMRIDCVVQHDGPRQLSVTLPNDLELLWKFADQPGIVAAARSVGKLAFMRDGLPASCTGFMIAGELMVTNRHCIDSQSRCNTAMVLFGYEQGKQGALTVQDQQDCLEYIDTPELSALDVAVIRVTGSPGASDRFGRLLLRDDDLPSQPEALQEATAGMFVVSHPGGAAKMVTKGDCSITTPLAVGDVEQQESDFGHKCDVSDGSSGAPILDINGRVIGIHHLGFDNIGRWNKENRAVRVDAVRKVFMELLQ